MTGDYAEILARVQNSLTPRNFELTENSDFAATLADPKDRLVIIEGDRVAYPALTLLISSPEVREPLALWIVMDVFARSHNQPPVIKSVNNQLAFLLSNLEAVFDFRGYIKDYEDALGTDIPILLH